MQGSDRKKINFILILIFGYFSISNISKFNDYDVLNPKIEIEEFTEINNQIDNYRFDERFELLKKESFEISKEELDDLELAKINPEVIKSDYINDEKNMNLSLIPINETMLFSGIPYPEQKPIPEKSEISKTTVISVKNKKT